MADSSEQHLEGTSALPLQKKVKFGPFFPEKVTAFASAICVIKLIRLVEAQQI